MGINIKQHDTKDCGAAALASVCMYYKLHIPIARVRQYANTDKVGTSMLGLVEAARILGFNARGVKAVKENLSEIHLPAIAHVLAQQKFPHFVVIYKITPKYIQVMDPELGEQKKVPRAEFERDWTGLLLLLTPDENFKTGRIGASKAERLFSLLKPTKAGIIQIVLGALVYTILGMASSIYVQKITDFVIPNYNGNLMNLLSVGMIVILVIQVAVGILRSIITLNIGQVIDTRLILGYYKHLTQLQQSFFDNMRVGEILSRVNDAVKIRSFINDVAVSFFVNICIVVFSFLLMYTYNWKMALIITLCIPFYGVLYIISNSLNKKTIRTVMEKSAELESQLVESINSMETIKQFALEEYSNLKTEDRFIDLLKGVYKVSINNIGIGFASDAFAKVFTIVLFWVGTFYIFNNELTPGELFSFYSLIGYFTGPVQFLISSNRAVQEAVIASDRLFEIMDLEYEDPDKGHKINITPALVGDIRFEKLEFKYGSRPKVFESVSFVIPHKQVTAIVGASGSGKSTLMGLLQKIYPVTGGKIFIGDCDLQYVSNPSLRSIISVVPQSINLFAGSIWENITIGDVRPNMEKVIKICKQLKITDFTEKFPNGLSTYIGENGATLSEGQKQKIGIARALYREFEILIMDEATSSLDGFSDTCVQEVLLELKHQNKTIIIITHKLSSITDVDNIIVLKDGKIVEEGTHDSLIESEGYYNNLWKYQV